MNAKLLQFSIATLAISSLSHAQVWEGSSTVDGAVFRNGFVSVGGNYPTARFNVVGSAITSHFHHGSNEDTYIRPGKANGFVLMDIGKVGIGTTTPSSQLDVHGVLELNNTSFFSSHTATSNLVTFIGANSYWTGGTYATPNPSTSGLSVELHNGGHALRLLQIPAGGGLPMPSAEIGFGGTNTFFNALGGNVGIGTTTPGDYKLAVNGSIRAKEVVVESAWADFVFDDAYRLKPLGEVENHISQHGRLPDVPSAAQVASDGLSLGEAQRIMMQKIEELTLYMIEKDKQVAALQAEVGALRDWKTLQQASGK